jgi:hypothetical protein
MPRFVFVQIENVDKAAKVEADTVVRESASSTAAGGSWEKLILKKGDKQVGEFDAKKVIGWWYQDE